MDARDFEVCKLSQTLAYNFFVSHRKNVERKEACEASKLATALGFKRNIGPGKEYIEGPAEEV